MVMTREAASEWKNHWPLPIAAALGYSTAVLYTYGLGPFIEPVQQAFGWSRAQISVGITIAGLTGALLSVPMGMVVDRLGPRTVGLIGIILMSAAFAALGSATGSTLNWIVLWCFIAFANLWLQATVWTSAVASRFQHSRGLAFGLTLSGGSLTAIVAPLLATWLISAYGWRTAFAVVGLVWAVVVFSVAFLAFRGAHEEAPARRSVEGAPPDLAGLSMPEALRTAAFYKLLLASTLLAFAVLGTVVHFVPILADRGADPLQAAGLASLVGVFSAVGRLGTGFLLDRFAANIVGALVFLLPVIACGLLLVDGTNVAYQAVAAACFGLAVGSEVDVIAYLTSGRFGLRSYGVIFGAMIGGLALGTALGPLVAGAVYDWHDSYVPFLGATIAAMTASSLAIATVRGSPP